MKILYLAFNPEAEYHEVSMLLKEGHQVFSLGEQILQSSVPEERKICQYSPREELTEKFWTLHPNYSPGRIIALRNEFIADFDLVTMSDYPEYLALNHKKILTSNTKLVWIWRKRPKSKPQHNNAVLNLKGKGLKVLELPISGRYKVTECREAWINFLQKL